MNFDPFGDFDTRGYLRNIVKEKDRDIVRRLEHSSFTTGIAAAFSSLATRKILTYSDVLGTHKILFEAIYPWAGEDRLTNASELAVSKAGLMFANPNHIQRAVASARQSIRWRSNRTSELHRYYAANATSIGGDLACTHKLRCPLLHQQRQKSGHRFMSGLCLERHVPRKRMASSITEIVLMTRRPRKAAPTP